MSEQGIRIIRPDLRNPDDYQISLDGETLMWFENSLLEKASRLHTDIAAHGLCDMRRSDGCAIRERWLINNYGSLTTAAQQGYYATDCSEDLAYLHHSLGDVMDFVVQSRYLRQRPGERAYGEAHEAVSQLMAIKAEINHREAASKSSTSVMGQLDDEKLAELDRQKVKSEYEVAIREQVEESMRKKETSVPAQSTQQERLEALSQNLRTKTR